MKIKSFHDLQVWQKAMDMVDIVYDLTASFPKSEMFGLTSQMRRSSISIASNIAEGSARNGTKELLQFLFITRGSLAELGIQLEIACRRIFCPPESYAAAKKYLDHVGQMTARLIQSLQTNNASPRSSHITPSRLLEEV